MTNYLELLYLIAFIGVLAVAYSYLLSGQIISSSAGNSRMQEIADAILKNKPHRASAEHAAHIIEVMEAIDISIKNKKMIEIHSNFTQPKLMDWAG